jgi:glycosyltransferase involved in cell wall biosynthesis
MQAPTHATRPHAILLYHYFHPDPVVSARQFADLAEGLTARGWDVTAMPAARGCRDEGETFPLRETWAGGRVERVWRPGWKQAKTAGRLLNTAWMLAAWGWRAMTTPRVAAEVVVVGTDPPLGVLAALPWRFFRTRTRVAHWCHDLYPEAAVADGLVRGPSLPVRVLKRVLAAAYRRCGLIADLGPCMRELLAEYNSPSMVETLTPWALVEPSEVSVPDPAVRNGLFGEANLGLLYSGTFGRAHSYAEFLELARLLRGRGVGFCFAGRGNRADELRAAVTPADDNVTFAGFAPEAELEKRLTACDLHLVSLRPEWTGTVVPSKFFGALAVGRGVVFAGSPDSAIARWIQEHDVGFVLTPDTLPKVAAALSQLAADPAARRALQDRCFAVYHGHFSRERQLDRWDAALRRVLTLS